MGNVPIKLLIMMPELYTQKSCDFVSISFPRILYHVI
jgi:hypothetical protein